MGGKASKLEAARKANESGGSLVGRTAIVVGGTSGIGRAVAVRLSKGGASVADLGRNETRGEEVVKEMKSAGEGKHLFIKCDAMMIGGDLGVDDSAKRAVAALGGDDSTIWSSVRLLPLCRDEHSLRRDWTKSLLSISTPESA